MLRKARMDTPGALHHISVRGIDRRKIFSEDPDRDDFLDRLGGILSDSNTPCFAWAFMTNYLHMLFRTGAVPIATAMGRLEITWDAHVRDIEKQNIGSATANVNALQRRQKIFYAFCAKLD